MKHLQPFKKYWLFTILFLVSFIFLVYAFLYKTHGVNNIEEAIWLVADPAITFLTFGTTLVIFYMQARVGWEESLEKKLSISYIYSSPDREIELLRIEDSYLAGESDIRAWAQSLGRQVFGNLEFDIAWDEKPPSIRKIKNKYFKTYSTRLFLNTNPFENVDTVNTKIKPFLEREFAQSEIHGSIDKLPIVWRRKNDEKNNG